MRTAVLLVALLGVTALTACANRLPATDAAVASLPAAPAAIESREAQQPRSWLILTSDAGEPALGDPPAGSSEPAFEDRDAIPAFPPVAALALPEDREDDVFAEDEPVDRDDGEPVELATPMEPPPAPPLPSDATYAAPAPTRPLPRLTRRGYDPACCPPVRSPCVDPCADPCADPCGLGYVGFAASVFPGVGGGIEYGMHFMRNSVATLSWEVGMQYQDLWKEFTDDARDELGAGKLVLARAGVRARFDRCGWGYPTLRGGIFWFHASGDPIDIDYGQIDYAGDYLGGYLGLGYEFDIGTGWTTGPEAAIFLGSNVSKLRDRTPGLAQGGREEVAIVPMLLWHLNYNF